MFTYQELELGLLLNVQTHKLSITLDQVLKFVNRFSDSQANNCTPEQLNNRLKKKGIPVETIQSKDIHFNLDIHNHPINVFDSTSTTLKIIDSCYLSKIIDFTNLNNFQYDASLPYESLYVGEILDRNSKQLLYSIEIAFYIVIGHPIADFGGAPYVSINKRAFQKKIDEFVKDDPKAITTIIDNSKINFPRPIAKRPGRSSKTYINDYLLMKLMDHYRKNKWKNYKKDVDFDGDLSNSAERRALSSSLKKMLSKETFANLLDQHESIIDDIDLQLYKKEKKYRNEAQKEIQKIKQNLIYSQIKAEEYHNMLHDINALLDTDEFKDEKLIQPYLRDQIKNHTNMS
ncbi:hypothetical protein IWT140_00467 [Secundilactobacillus pentosiphilus]|uniref:Uncharacterized protein n=1 Tax=Secundilactobacillus pentosiphilus TaxID=1714682 RepID=A0A1Z5IM97_9LACO|nr:hypothetical protein [Secundilactobacillus pentosiphilus]GAX02869.1 hypothetical protein IWT140_00467 [Secundilactobacillus pentosiphilus]